MQPEDPAPQVIYGDAVRPDAMARRCRTPRCQQPAADVEVVTSVDPRSQDAVTKQRWSETLREMTNVKSLELMDRAGTR